MDDLSRYSRQTRFAPIGEAGQRALAGSRVLICGCGALGSTLAEMLVRAGVGQVRIVDRDFVDRSNLQRQSLFDEADVEQHLPKAVAAAQRLRTLNRDVSVEPIVADIGPDNILEFGADCTVWLDGSDNFELRYLINDASLETGTPWIYGGVIGAFGQSLPIVPHRTACLRCVIDSPPDPGQTETCDTAGVIGPAVHVVASIQATSALKLIVGGPGSLRPEWVIVDLWNNSWRTIDVGPAFADRRCAACHGGRRDWLRGDRSTRAAVLCGRNSVQILPAERAGWDWQALASRLQPLGRVTQNAFLTKFTPQSDGAQAASATSENTTLHIFRDGRAIIEGVSDVAAARGLYARYLGS